MGRTSRLRPRDVGHRYDEWLTSRTPSALYVRWYLNHRRPAEYLHLLDTAGAPVPRLLDVGCATGLPLRYARERGFGDTVLAGVDVSEKALAVARERLTGGPAGSGHVVLELASADALPFDDAAFDAIICNGLVKYLDDAALLGALGEMRRVCAPEGAVAIGEFGPRVTQRFAGVWRFAAIEEYELRDADALQGALRSAGWSEVRRVEIPRIRRFPYDYVGLAAKAR